MAAAPTSPNSAASEGLGVGSPGPSPGLHLDSLPALPSAPSLPLLPLGAGLLQSGRFALTASHHSLVPFLNASAPSCASAAAPLTASESDRPNVEAYSPAVFNELLTVSDVLLYAEDTVSPTFPRKSEVAFLTPSGQTHTMIRHIPTFELVTCIAKSTSADRSAIHRYLERSSHHSRYRTEGNRPSLQVYMTKRRCRQSLGVHISWQGICRTPSSQTVSDLPEHFEDISTLWLTASSRMLSRSMRKSCEWSNVLQKGVMTKGVANGLGTRQKHETATNGGDCRSCGCITGISKSPRTISTQRTSEEFVAGRPDRPRYRSKMSRLASLTPSGTPSRSRTGSQSPAPSPSASTPGTPRANTRQIETTHHRMVKLIISELKSLFKTWDELVLVDGMKAGKGCIDEATEME